MLQDVCVAAQHVYGQVRHPEFPADLTVDVAWSTLRETWADERYWLSVEELFLVSCWNGPEVKIYRQVVDAAGTEALELLDRGLLPPLESPETCERVVLSMDDKQEYGCHFSKLLTDTAWGALEQAQEEKAESSCKSDASTSEDS